MGLYTKRNRLLISVFLDLDPAEYLRALRSFRPSLRRTIVIGLLIKATSY